METVDICEMTHRCGHCLYPITKMQPVKGISLVCRDCGSETTYKEAAQPQSVQLQSEHICSHIIHDEGRPLLRLLLVRDRAKQNLIRRTNSGVNRLQAN